LCSHECCCATNRCFEYKLELWPHSGVNGEMKFGRLGIRGADRYRTFSEERIVQMLVLAGRLYENESPIAEEASRQVLHAWMQKGLEFRRTAHGQPLFDPVEVFNFMKRIGLDGLDDFWSKRFVPTRRRLVLDLAELDLSRTDHEAGRRFTIDFRRAFHLRDVVPGSRLRLRAPLPLSGDHLTDCEVKPYVEPRPEAQINLTSGRMEARLAASGETEIILGARFNFTAHLQQPRSGECRPNSETAFYLSEREGLIVVSERVRALARSLASPSAQSIEVIRAFWDYINNHLICGAVHYDQIDLANPCDWVLDSGWFDCQLGSALFVALCRSHGIAARLVGGYLLYRMAPTNHYWSEVWMEDQGWTPFDFLGWDLAQGGRDVEWRDRFFGRLDYRLMTERLPREFTGAVGVPIPQEWCLLQVPKPGGVEINLTNINGERIYVDTIRVLD
jgi:hypothetical protein